MVPELFYTGAGKYALSGNWLVQETMVASVLNPNFFANKTSDFGQDTQYVTYLFPLQCLKSLVEALSLEEDDTHGRRPNAENSGPWKV